MCLNKLWVKNKCRTTLQWFDSGYSKRMLCVFDNDQWQTWQKRVNLSKKKKKKAKPGSSVKADQPSWVAVSSTLDKITREHNDPIDQLSPISSLLVKNILLIIWYAAPLLVFTCTTSDFGHSLVKREKKKIQSHVSSPWSRISNPVQY